MKKTVLDDQAAAQFSTAAALEAGKGRAIGVDWRDSTLGNVQPRGVSAGCVEPHAHCMAAGMCCAA